MKNIPLNGYFQHIIGEPCTKDVVLKYGYYLKRYHSLILFLKRLIKYKANRLHF